MRYENTTDISVTIEINGKQVCFTQKCNNHELEEATTALLNSVLLLESNLNA